MTCEDGIGQHYSEEDFWKKIANYAKTAGKEVVEKSLQLYYAAQDPDTPAWAKGIIYGALGYFILPIDAIPDFTPVIGYTDDFAVLAAAFAAVALHITPEVKQKAREKLHDWFGD